MSLTRLSPAKVNLILNVLGRRADGFHELETLLQPVPIHDRLELSRTTAGVQLTCSLPELPVDAGNLVWRAATCFLERAGIRDGIRIHLEKRLPLAAGLGGGSSNAAHTLAAMNTLFDHPLSDAALHELAAGLGSDVPFFLHDQPALGLGRGEQVTLLPAFAALRGAAILLYHPGFGIATAWAYRELAHFPVEANGQAGRATALAEALRRPDLTLAARGLYNSLEAPAIHKYPVLALYQEFLKEQGAAGALMSGSGSTTFALFADQSRAEAAAERFRGQFGTAGWLRVVPLDELT